MKVTQKKLDDGRLLIDAVASTAEVSNALNNAHLAFAQQMGMRRVLVFLQNYGISPNLAMRIGKYYGENTVELIRENPYRMVMDIDGVGFLTADRIALSMGMDPQSSASAPRCFICSARRPTGRGIPIFPGKCCSAGPQPCCMRRKSWWTRRFPMRCWKK